MIRAGLVRLNGAPGARRRRRRAPATQSKSRAPSAMPTAATSPGDADAPAIEVLYADDEIVVVNKPAGMTVHPAPGHPGGTLVDALLARFPEMAAMAEPGGVMRPGIVHRLDKDTSGVMVVARTPFARMELARQFKERTVSKIYLAVVRGVGRTRALFDCAPGRTPSGRAQADVGELTPRPRGVERGLRARADAGGGRRRDARRSAAADRPHPSDSRTPGFDRASVPWRSALRRPPAERRRRMTTFADATSSFKRQALHALALRLSHPRTADGARVRRATARRFAGFLMARGVAAGRTELERWIRGVSGVALPSARGADGKVGPLTAQRGSDNFDYKDLRIEPRQARLRIARSRQVTRRRLGVASPSRPSASIHLIGLGRTGSRFRSGS